MILLIIVYGISIISCNQIDNTTYDIQIEEMSKAQMYLKRQLQMYDHDVADKYTLYLAIKNYNKRLKNLLDTLLSSLLLKNNGNANDNGNGNNSQNSNGRINNNANSNSNGNGNGNGNGNSNSNCNGNGNGNGNSNSNSNSNSNNNSNGKSNSNGNGNSNSNSNCSSNSNGKSNGNGNSNSSSNNCNNTSNSNVNITVTPIETISSKTINLPTSVTGKFVTDQLKSYLVFDKWKIDTQNILQIQDNPQNVIIDSTKNQGKGQLK